MRALGYHRRARKAGAEPLSARCVAGTSTPGGSVANFVANFEANILME
jgi:hypothetical protein